MPIMVPALVRSKSMPTPMPITTHPAIAMPAEEALRTFVPPSPPIGCGREFGVPCPPTSPGGRMRSHSRDEGGQGGCDAAGPRTPLPACGS